jgi:two-component system, NtrC family, sensor kinase
VPGRLALTRGTVGGRAVRDMQLIQVADLQAEADEYPENSDIARRLGYCTILTVPLMHAGNAMGVIAIRRTEVRPFSDQQIALLKTFADQAVIAIENTRLRLFEQVQSRTREATDRSTELARALEQQTATSDVLRIISRSPTNVQPVFDTIARSAAMLYKAQLCNVFRFDGQLPFTWLPATFPALPKVKSPMPVNRRSVQGEATARRARLLAGMW